ncbi:unnamed protein product [Adineta steineri]|uniref:Large-conductance mechanosensitive channel n=1 Tax=Adineta steineri TaxID=433720 RepID=A0A814EWP7_9BILA|nr:unnamed protein product [Adineta steineri]CAF1377260.1 unnamed protein product [Adineta steineri]
MKILNSCNFCKKFCKEFKEFALQGNVFELAIGIIIGTAFANVVKSLVEDIITPPFGLLLGGVDFRDLTVEMHNFVYQDQPPVVIRYGKFIQELIYLLIIGLVLFFIIKSINKLHGLATKRQLEEGMMKKQELSNEVKVLLEIRDILIKQTPVIDEIML